VILVDARLVADGNAGRHKYLYWFRLLESVITYIQFLLLVYLALVCSRGGTNSRERGERPKSLESVGRKRICGSRLIRKVAGKNCPEFLQPLS
jgi:hypothetical protein